MEGVQTGRASVALPLGAGTLHYMPHTLSVFVLLLFSCDPASLPTLYQVFWLSLPRPASLVGHTLLLFALSPFFRMVPFLQSRDTSSSTALSQLLYVVLPFPFCFLRVIQPLHPRCRNCLSCCDSSPWFSFLREVGKTPLRSLSLSELLFLVRLSNH